MPVQVKHLDNPIGLSAYLETQASMGSSLKPIVVQGIWESPSLKNCPVS